MKTVNKLNPSFMKNIFTSKENARARPNNIVIKNHDPATYGDKSLMTIGPKIKSETSYIKSLITYANPFAIEYFIKLLP